MIVTMLIKKAVYLIMLRPRKGTPPKQAYLAEEKIRVKAYELWNLNKSLSPEESWNLAIKRLTVEQQFRPLIMFWHWTGLGEKKGWDILTTLSLPLFIFLGGILFTHINNQQQNQLSVDKRDQDTLVKYLDEMTKLLNDNLHEVKSRNDSKFIIAQAKTVIALQSLDPSRQHLIIQFLDAARLNKLIEYGLLYQAQMSKANFKNADLSGATFKSVNLTNANLQHSNLTNADLEDSILSNANLSNSDLTGARLDAVYMKNSNLSGIIAN
ncbi:MAG: pentapeptide repeat-containing protein, partial [Snowella sp.]